MESECLLGIDGWRLFKAVFGKTWQEAAGMKAEDYVDWVVLRNQLVHGRATVPNQTLQRGCVFLCQAMTALMAWGKNQSMAYDGLAHLGTIGLPTDRTADGSLTDRLEEKAEDISGFPKKRWEAFKTDLLKVSAGNTAD